MSEYIAVGYCGSLPNMNWLIMALELPENEEQDEEFYCWLGKLFVANTEVHEYLLTGALLSELE